MGFVDRARVDEMNTNLMGGRSLHFFRFLGEKIKSLTGTRIDDMIEI